jgi:16S rRNA U516 pseudouridylate synthase RsuA-like enzyme
MTLYVSDQFKFKKIYIVKLASAIAQSQVAKLAKGVPGFDAKVTFISDMKDVQ